MVLEDATSKGLFNFYLRSKNRVALCAIDECHEWFKTVVGCKSTSSAPSMKRLLQCYDGSHWYENKINTNKRKGVPLAALALTCFTQLDAFLRKVMPKLVSNSNGLLDRFLLCLPLVKSATISERIEASKKLKETNLTSLEKLYEQIYAKHNNSDKVIYLLEEETLEIYVRHSQKNPLTVWKATPRTIRISSDWLLLYTYSSMFLSRPWTKEFKKCQLRSLHKR